MSLEVKKAVRLSLLGAALNGSLALIKGGAGWFGHSHALMADAVESLSDVFSSLVVWAGMKLSLKPPDENHPYGHGKFEPMAAIVVALILFGAAVGILVASIREIIAPSATPHLFTLPVLLFVIVIKWILSRKAEQLSGDIASQALRGDALHHQSDALTSLAALIGISVAVIGGPGFERADGFAALFASGVIVVSSFRIFAPAVRELADAAPRSDIGERAKGIAGTVSGVAELEKCFVRKMGLFYYIDLHVIVDENLTVREGHSIAHRVEEAIQAAVPQVAEVLVHIEPTGGPVG